MSAVLGDIRPAPQGADPEHRATPAEAEALPAAGAAAPPRGPAPPRPSLADAKRQALLDRLIDGAMRQYASLLIERDSERSGFVYTIIDKRTGDVIRRWPRAAAAAALGDAPAAQGAFFDQRV